MKRLICVLSICVFVVGFSGLAFAMEHPGERVSEHPGEGPGHEHPGEHPGQMATLSANEIIMGVEKHISDVTATNNGVFPLRDTEESKDLRLKLVKIHKDKVSYIKKDDAYFACTDFGTEDGKDTYDVDFRMKKDVSGKLNVYMTKVHKKNGTPRFVYKDDEIVEVK